MNRINNIELNDVSLTCKPVMENFNSWPETLTSFSYTFSPGKVYAIISEPGNGGWALSYLIAGKVRRFKGNLLINHKLADSKILKTYGWYVGEGLSHIFRRKTVRDQLGSPRSNKYTSESLIDLFELSSSRLDRQIKYISNERWNASTAIGLGQGKQVFCFPWLDDMWKDALRVRLKHCAEILKREECIVIIPTSSLRIIEDFVDDIIYL